MAMLWNGNDLRTPLAIAYSVANGTASPLPAIRVRWKSAALRNEWHRHSGSDKSREFGMALQGAVNA